jgi:hypothetical protein
MKLRLGIGLVDGFICHYGTTKSLLVRATVIAE